MLNKTNRQKAPHIACAVAVGKREERERERVIWKPFAEIEAISSEGTDNSLVTRQGKRVSEY